MAVDHVDTIGTTVSIDGTNIIGLDKDNIPIPDGDTEDKDTSTLDSGRTKRKGLGMFDPGSCEISGNKLSGDAGQIALQAAYGDRKLHTFQVNVLEAGEIYEYEAYVTKFNPGSDSDTYKFSSKLLASGPFTLSTTFAGVTSIEGAGAGITYSPAVMNSAFPAIPANATITQIRNANTAIIKEATGVTTDTIEVTAAAASSISISYDEGDTWTALTSGTPASVPTANWPAAGAITHAIVQVKEDNKATRFIDLFIARA